MKLKKRFNIQQIIHFANCLSPFSKITIKKLQYGRCRLEKLCSKFILIPILINGGFPSG